MITLFVSFNNFEVTLSINHCPFGLLGKMLGEMHPQRRKWSLSLSIFWWWVITRLVAFKINQSLGSFYCEFDHPYGSSKKTLALWRYIKEVKTIVVSLSLSLSLSLSIYLSIYIWSWPTIFSMFTRYKHIFKPISGDTRETIVDPWPDYPQTQIVLPEHFPKGVVRVRMLRLITRVRYNIKFRRQVHKTQA